METAGGRLEANSSFHRRSVDRRMGPIDGDLRQQRSVRFLPEDVNELPGTQVHTVLWYTRVYVQERKEHLLFKLPGAKVWINSIGTAVVCLSRPNRPTLLNFCLRATYWVEAATTTLSPRVATFQERGGTRRGVAPVRMLWCSLKSFTTATLRGRRTSQVSVVLSARVGVPTT